MDAKQLEEDVGASPRSFGGPSNDTKHVKARKPISEEGRARISAAWKRHFIPRLTGPIAPGVDPDFDEMGF